MGTSNCLRHSFLPPLALAAVVAGAAARGWALDPVQAALALDPSVAAVGQTVNAVLTVTNTGALDFTLVNPSLSFDSGSGLVAITSIPYQSASITIPSGGAVAFTWTLVPNGTGMVRMRAAANGYINSQFLSFASTAVLGIPGPTEPPIRIFNNVLRPGRAATIILHGGGHGEATLVVYDQSGSPLGEAGVVRLDRNGFGSARFDGTVRGRRLPTGIYWIAASGSVGAKVQVLVTSK